MVIIVSPSSGIQSMADLQARARRPGGINFGSGGTGTLGHLAGASLLSELGGRGTHVSYRGSAPAVQGVISGEIDMFFGDTLLATSLKDSVRLLALTSKERMPVLPDVPTTAELGLPGLNSKLWFAFLAPSATPQPILKRLYDAFLERGSRPSLQGEGELIRLRARDHGGRILLKVYAGRSLPLGQVIKANGIRSGD
jgi:tripartite-type tricarboxylate transporter receptor subunit TctC